MLKAVKDIVEAHFARDIDAICRDVDAEPASPARPWDEPGALSKACACGAVYVRDAFHSLPYVGVMDDGVEKLVLRNCPCGSTIAIEVPR